MICEACGERKIESLPADGEWLMYLCPLCMSKLYPELCLAGTNTVYNIDYTF